MTLPEFLHEHVVILFPVIPLMTTGRNEILVPVALAMQIPAIAVHPWIEEVSLSDHYPVQLWRIGKLHGLLLLKL